MNESSQGLEAMNQKLQRMVQTLQDDPDNEPVDVELVRQFANNELDAEEGQYVGWLCGTYRNWYNEFLAAVEQRRSDLF